MTKRSRWGAADTDRLNEGLWTKATGQPINRDLADDKETLRFRSSYEAANNPYIEGMIGTFADDVVGKSGPTLQVVSDDKKYNSALEAIFELWAKAPDLNGQLSLAEMLRLDLREMWSQGEFVTQFAMAPADQVKDADLPIATRLHAIAAHRLKTAHNNLGDFTWTMGVRRDKFGRPLEYSFEDIREDLLATNTFEFRFLPARDVIHGFDVLEPGQARGAPWLATSLDTAANHRDYRESVLESAREAAKRSAVLQTNHPDVDPVIVNDEQEIERGMMTTVPPGWEMKPFEQVQPTATFKEFHNELLREYGRPVNMPLMLVALDASDHNFSSARFDGQGYARAIAYRQGWLERVKLNRCVQRLAIEARRLATADELPKRFAALANPPEGGVTYRWSWPARPHVDPFKEGMGERVGLENGTVDPITASASRGLDYEEVLDNRQRAVKEHEKRGLPLPSYLRDDAKPLSVNSHPDDMAEATPVPDADTSGLEDDDEADFRRILAAHENGVPA